MDGNGASSLLLLAQLQAGCAEHVAHLLNVLQQPVPATVSSGRSHRAGTFACRQAACKLMIMLTLHIFEVHAICIGFAVV